MSTSFKRGKGFFRVGLEGCKGGWLFKMQEYQDYAFVTNGERRRDIIVSLGVPRRAKELVRELKLHFSVVSKILRQLCSHGLVESFDNHGRRYFRLTERGEAIRRILLE